MKRRNFVWYSSLLGAGVVAGCKSNGIVKPVKILDENDLFELSIAEIQSHFRSGTLTSVQLVEYYLKRMKDIDQRGPKINSIIEINPDALAIAAEKDEERKEGQKDVGPLHGIPIVIKDNINTGDKMQTTAGSLALEGHIAAEDAPVIKLLRGAGMIIMAKTNLSEWANFRSTKSTSGWSSRGGQTLNPYVLTQNPCGSSAGSGAAIAADLCTVSIGTETDGSVTCPAAVCGIVGLKPSIGLVSRTGIIPISHTQDTAGPMGRTVADVAALLNVMIGYDPKDPITKPSATKKMRDYTRFLNAEGLKGKRIGIDPKSYSKDTSINAVLQKMIAELESAGATVVEVNYLESTAKAGDNEFELLMYEFKDGLNKYLTEYDAPVSSLAEIIQFNKNNKEKAMPHFQQELLEMSQEKEGLDSEVYQKLRKIKGKIQAIIDGTLKDNQLDAIMGITVGPASTIDYDKGDVWADVYTPPPAAMAGYAHITVPGGYLNGLPLGLSLFAGAFTEGPLIEMGYAYEQATNHRKPPEFRESM